MINPIQNTYNFFKYGKIVHKSPTGEVIRKKINYRMVTNDGKDTTLHTTKTFFNKDGKITSQLERNANFDELNISTSVIKDKFDTKTGLPVREPRRSKQYSSNPDIQRIVDYTKCKYDYGFRELSNGKTEYTIYYPEVTLIDKVNNTVKTSSEHKTYIK